MNRWNGWCLVLIACGLVVGCRAETEGGDDADGAPPLTACFLAGTDLVSDRGVVLASSGGDWSAAGVPEDLVTSTGYDLTAVAACADGSAFVVGRILGGRGVALRYDGSAWTAEAVPGISADWGFTAVTCPDGGPARAAGWDEAGRAGVFLERDGDAWVRADDGVDLVDVRLGGLAFPEPDAGYAVGHRGEDATLAGVVYRYEDGEWQPLDTGLALDRLALRDVDFASPDAGWAVGPYREGGPEGRLLVYDHGTWRLGEFDSSVAPGFVFQAAALAGEDEGWIVGSAEDEQDGLYASTCLALHFAAGEWERVDSGCPVQWGSDEKWSVARVALADAENGWAVGTRRLDWGEGIDESAVVLRLSAGVWTIDDGVPEGPLLADVAAGPGESWLAGADAALYRRAEAEWERIAPPLQPAQWDVRAVDLQPGGEGWTVGARDAERAARRAGLAVRWTADGPEAADLPFAEAGATWTVEAVSAPTPSEAWIAGHATFPASETDEALLFHCADATCEAVDLADVVADRPDVLDEIGRLGPLDFRSPDEGWMIVGWTDGVLLARFDGNAWTTYVPDLTDERISDGAARIVDLRAAADAVWLAGHVGDTGVLARWDKDAGEVVQRLSVGFARYPASIALTPGGDVLVAGAVAQRGFLFRYRDGARSDETPAVDSANWRLTRVAMLSEPAGFAVGRDGERGRELVFRYGGGAWSLHDAGYAADRVRFADLRCR
jgi:hypothetical protein